MPIAPTSRIPALDGWRGIAILLVLADHVQSQWLGRYLPYLHTGQHGVTLFFVLSGFLITNNLLQNQSLKTFYVRRFFRLMPVAWAYLAFLWIMGCLYPVNAPPVNELISSLFFFRNYVNHQVGFLPSGHFWSLSLEEQFYLLWPPILFLLGRRKSAWFATVAIAGCTTWRLIHWGAYNVLWMSFRTEVRADAICVGCLLAIVLHNERGRQIVTRILPFAQYPAAFLFIVLAALTAWLPLTIESLAIAVLLGCSILKPQGALTRTLSIRPLTALGRVSYSLYVWQQFFFAPYGLYADILLNALALPCALCMYFLIERPFTNFGRRLTTPKIQQPQQLAAVIN